jgi:hypothetical protein
MRQRPGSARRSASRLAALWAALALASPALARTEWIRWVDPNDLDPAAPPIAGYRIHVGREPGVYERVIDVGMPARASSGLLPLFRRDVEVDEYAPVYLAVTAYDDLGRESERSNEIVRRPQDTDLDGIPDDGAPGSAPCAPGQSVGCDDNCPYAANPTQQDAGGVGSELDPDGIGDACQCGDVSGDGLVTMADAMLILGGDPEAAGMARPDLCDVGAGPGCGPPDGYYIVRALVPPPSAAIRQQCPPAQPPG